MSQPGAVRQQGFTLIEVMIVLALSGLMLVLAFAGQHQLIARSRFDGEINKMIQDIAYARNYSNANVNIDGTGDRTDAVLAGVGYELDNGHANGQLAELEPVYCDPDDCSNTYDDVPAHNQSLCPRLSADHECFEEFFDSGDLKLVGHSSIEIIYLNTATRGIRICDPIIDGSQTIGPACQTNGAGSVVFTVQDGNGFTTDISIDATSGLARRLN
jgi:prepilin-type N-terminal cleavage/methylation domain-containing protein